MQPIDILIQSDIFGDQNKIAIKWNLEARTKRTFDFPATHKKFDTREVEILHFEADKIKEAWSVTDMSVLVT